MGILFFIRRRRTLETENYRADPYPSLCSVVIYPSFSLTYRIVGTSLRSAGSTKSRPFSSSSHITTGLHAQRLEIQRRLQELQALVMQSEVSLTPASSTPYSLSPGGRGGDEQMEELRRTITQLEEEIIRLQPPAYEQPEIDS
jgi:hypothetical protein